MTDTLVTTTLFTPGMTVEAMRAAEGGASAVLRSVREQWLAWCRETNQPREWGTNVLGEHENASTRNFWIARIQTDWAADLLAFSTWALRHPEQFTAVPSGDTDNSTIGPETPGWAEFWEKVRELAEEDGYEEQYNTLAEAFGAPEIDDQEVELDVEVRIEPFYVTIRRTMTRRQLRDIDNEDLDDLGIDQADIDEAIREHIAQENVDFNHSETTVVDD